MAIARSHERLGYLELDAAAAAVAGECRGGSDSASLATRRRQGFSNLPGSAIGYRVRHVRADRATEGLWTRIGLQAPSSAHPEPGRG